MIKLVRVWFTCLLVRKLIDLIYHVNFPIPLNILQKAAFKLYCMPLGRGWATCRK